MRSPKRELLLVLVFWIALWLMIGALFWESVLAGKPHKLAFLLFAATTPAGIWTAYRAAKDAHEQVPIHVSDERSLVPVFVFIGACFLVYRFVL